MNKQIIPIFITIDNNYVQVMYAYDDYFIFTDENGRTGVINALTKSVEIEPKYDFVILIDGSKAFQAIDGANKLFDPTYHQAVLTEHVDGVEPGMVLEVLQKGYLLKDKVIRPAMVKVSE